MAGKALSSLRDPHAIRVIEQLQETGQRLAATALPKLAQGARQTGRTVAEFAQARSKEIADRLADSDPASLVKLGRSSGLLATAGKGVARFALRRPVMLAVGAVAVIGVAAAIGRRVKAAQAENDIGEGSYQGAKDYRERTERFARDKGNVARKAEEARDALEGGEGPSLSAAEQQGLQHARS